MQKYSKELVINGLSLLTESSRILEGALFERGLIPRERFNRIIAVCL